MNCQDKNGGLVDFAKLAKIASLGTPKGGDAYRRRRMTKGRLIKIYERRKQNMSPELGVDVVEGGDDIELKTPYEIVNVEDVTTEVSFYKGVRVEMLSAKDEMGSVMLWKRGKVGVNSKLGVFISLFGSNTDKWLHKWVLFEKWEKNQRNVYEVPASPSSMVREAVKAGGKIESEEPAKKSKK